MADEDIQQKKRPGPVRRLYAAAMALLLFLLLVVALVWAFRVRIATEYIDRELRKRQVDATYDVRRIGPGSQVFENLVIGDPANPDLTARRVEVEVELGLSGPEIGLIKARGVRVRGRIVDGAVDLGQLDRLTPPTPDDQPFRLPDQRVDLADAAIVLDTPGGRVAVAVEGRGNLADGFEGRAALRSRGLRLGECALPEPRARLAVEVEDGRPSLSGPLTMAALRCGEDLAVRAPRFDVNATLGADFQSWRGRADVAVASLAAGPHALRDLAGDLSFTGNAERTTGAVRIGAASAQVAGARAGRTRLDAGYLLSLEDGDLRMRGDLALAGLRAEREAVAPVVAALRGLDGLPVDPVGEALADALVRAATAGSEARGSFTLINRSGEGAVRFDRLQLDSASGAALRVSGGEGIAFTWPDRGLQVDGNVAVSGGGLPQARFALRQERPGGPIEGRGRVAPMAARGARLDLGEIRFTAAPDGTTRLRTVARMSGPFQGGRVEGLELPVEARFGNGRFAFGETCLRARFRSFEYGALAIGPTALPLCPVGGAMAAGGPGGIRGGFSIAEPRIAATIGGSPLQVAADSLRFGLDRTDFAASGVKVAIGAAPSQTRIGIGTLAGRIGEAGVAGDFEALTTAIPGVPLDVGEGAGRWRLAGGELFLDGRLRVADAQDPPRFHPLVSEDFSLVLSGNDIRAGGWLFDPETGVRVTQASIAHDLATGWGEAVLDVPGIEFAPGGLQPETLTPLTVGVVALVDGVVRGQGVIRWNEVETTSTGSFGTEGMDLAAPFGPVEGLTTRIEFTDLLGLVSAPDQVATIDRVQAGIDIRDGRIVYRLLPNYHVGVAQGRWPFAGGELLLEPTVLDFSQPSTKYLTFRVAGMEAAHFVQQMEFGNIAATGTFDGVIPLQIDANGAAIVGGRLSARPPGGTLSYIGELTDRDLGVYGKLAFDALKALRYSRFEMQLDGALDGEFFTRIELDGVARDPQLTQIQGGGIRGLVARRALGQLARIPFEFNIAIQGPFRSLMATARSFDDPTLLIEQSLPELLRGRIAPGTDVQIEESEDMP